MKRYLLFAFDDCYPSGGLNDLEGHFESLEEIIFFINNIAEYPSDYYQVLDTGNQEILYYDEGEFS